MAGNDGPAAHPISRRWRVDPQLVGYARAVVDAEDLGSPGSFLTLTEGTAVYARDGEEVGRVEHVLAEPEIDIFDGVVLDRSKLPGGHRFVDAAHVGDIYERGVVLTLLASEAGQLPEPEANPGDRDAVAGDRPARELEDKLRRAWELISGR